MITIYQLGFNIDKFPKEVPIVDCRIIPNPFSKYRLPKERREAVRKHKGFQRLVDSVMYILAERNDVVIACGYGVDRSGAVVEEVLNRLDSRRVSWEVKKGSRNEWKIITSEEKR